MSSNPFTPLVDEETERKYWPPSTGTGTPRNHVNQLDGQLQRIYPEKSFNQISIDATSPRSATNDEEDTVSNLHDNSSLDIVNSVKSGLSEHNPLSSPAPSETSENYIYNNDKNFEFNVFSQKSPEMGSSTSFSHVPSFSASYVPANSFKRVSNLDPGSVSTVSDKQFFGKAANSPLPSRNRSSSMSSHSSRRKFSNPISISDINQQRHISKNPSFSAHKILESSSSSQISNPKPEIYVTNVDTAVDSAPALPAKPSLPPRPVIHTRNLSAHELLNNYSQNSFSDQQVSTNSAIAGNSCEPSPRDLFSQIDTFEGIVVTEELIRQQKEIEESIRRRQLEENAQCWSPVLAIETDQSVPSNINFDSGSNVDNVSVDSSNIDSVSSSRDVSQLEIPSSLFRSTSNSSETESETGSSVILVDMFATGDITEEEFISLLPPVPEYTKIPRETELSIPNGKAIDILQINESHPQESPPDYTPLTQAMKQLIRRPQFSQTGGDNQTYSRRQQQQLRQIENRIQQQEHMSAYYDLPLQREDSSEERNRIQYNAPPLPLRPIFYGARGIMLTDRNPYVRRVYPLNYLTPTMYRRY